MPLGTSKSFVSSSVSSKLLQTDKSNAKCNINDNRLPATLLILGMCCVCEQFQVSNGRWHSNRMISHNSTFGETRYCVGPQYQYSILQSESIQMLFASNCAMPRVYTVGRLFLFLIFNNKYGATEPCQRVQFLCFQWSLVHWSQLGFSLVFSSWTLDSKLIVTVLMVTLEPPTRVGRYVVFLFRNH